MIAVLIINYRTVEATLACLASVLPELPDAATIHLLDNDSGVDQVQRLEAFAAEHSNCIRLQTSDRNLGYAGGMNRLIASALAMADVEQIVLLNNDTIATPGFISAMQAQLDESAKVDMVAARLLHADRDEVESLGITVYRSTLASNRKRDDEILLGPTGGCALLTRRLLEDLMSSHGEWFDESFFCYAEDTDLVLRARWLGYLPGYAADAIVRHHGSLSSGGADNTFVLYHGIRNSIWWLYKNAPMGWLLRSLPYFVVLHAAIWVRHLRLGRTKVLWRLYRDAALGLPRLAAKRRRIAATRRLPPKALRDWIEPHFYERGYLARAWRQLW